MAVLGTILITVGILAAIGFFSMGFFLGYSKFIRDFIKQEVKKQTRLENGTDQYDRWKKLPFPLEFRIYVFNVTNPHEIEHKGAIPIVHEVGPFVYHEHFHKDKIERQDKNDILMYNQYLKMTFQRQLSAYGDDIKITVPNLPLQGVFQNEEDGDLPPAIQNIAVNRLWPRAFRNDGIFVTLPVKRFFFEGYIFCNTTVEKPKKDLGLIQSILETAMNVARQIFCNQVRKVAASNPTIIPGRDHLKFSMFKHKDNNTDGRFEILAGITDINKLGQIQTWNKTSHLNLWAGGTNSTCNAIRGTDSTIYAPWTFAKSSTLLTFNTDICRTVKLTTIEEINFKGIPGVKAIMGPDNMENSGESSCYCINKTRNLAGDHDCFPKGFCDMGNCLKAPIIISFPHMLWADAIYRDTVKGLEPSEEKHVSFVALEPTTGTPLQGRKRMQFNVPMRPIKEIQVTHHLTAAMVPVLWVEESFDLPDDMVAKVKADYVNKMFMLDVTVYVMLGGGLIGGTMLVMYLVFPRY
ncbi:scavenger receptor class b type-1 sr-b1 [Holotrichia oblita]|uniref:Scavenger receptor class b type-1 sr-b1 n=1 Tax=Holotrichia oblita TaxID=644536 RepID=A0ACB9TXQ6_HOLOL|nr:scavenger receptor class b type-1 sr-b1 [Holotrichia oblita]